MSEDRRRKVDQLDTVKEPRQIAVDTASEPNESTEKPIGRRRKPLVSGTNASRHRIYNIIPKGYVPRLVSMEKGRPQRLYEEDWEFVTAEDGHSHIYEIVNNSKGANETRHVWMMKKEEYYIADTQEKAKQRSRALGQEGREGIDKKDPFFKDTGLSKDDEFLL